MAQVIAVEEKLVALYKMLDAYREPFLSLCDRFPYAKSCV